MKARRDTRKQRSNRRRRLLTKRRRGGEYSFKNFAAAVTRRVKGARSPVGSNGSHTSDYLTESPPSSPKSPLYTERGPLCPEQSFNSKTPNSFGKTEMEVFTIVKKKILNETMTMLPAQKKKYIEETIQSILYDPSYFISSVGHIIRDPLKEKIANELCNMMLKGTEQKIFRIQYNPY